MAECPFRTMCPISVNRDKTPWRHDYAEDYCFRDSERCARRSIREEKGLSAVPETLLPDGTNHTRSVFEKDW